MAETKTETIRGPVELVMSDGSRFTTETRISRVDDWQETPLGPVNLGHVRIWPGRIVRIQGAANG